MRSHKFSVTYVFGYGRKKILSSKNIYAQDFFYGFNFFKKDLEGVNMIEFEDKSNKILLTFLSKVLRKLTKLSFFFENICTFKNLKTLLNSKNIIITNDRIGLSLLPFLIILKLFNINKTSVIVMGLLAKETNNIISHILQRIFLNLFFACVNNFIFLSKGEFLQAKVSYRKFSDNFYFIPFCIDSKFWTKSKRKSTGKEILFIGNDGRREYKLAIDIAKELSDYKFTFITSNIKHSELKSKNITLINGQWNNQILSDEEMREIYSNANLSIIPIRNSYQPSGQSVALQSMSMEVPVLITETVGFWDKDIFLNNKSIVFVKENNLIKWVEEIKRIFENDRLRTELSENAKDIILKKYDSLFFYRELKKIIF